MKYRVVEKSDGMFHLQYRVLLFWWSDSCTQAVESEAEAVEKAKFMEGRIMRVVYP